MTAAIVTTPSVTITDDLVATLVDRGGYIHPLFNPTTDDGPRPLPGQAVLLLMGGLCEQSGALDDAIALLEIASVRFHAMVTAGSTLHCEIRWGAITPTSSTEKSVAELTWTAIDGDGTTVAEADVRMLVRP